MTSQLHICNFGGLLCSRVATWKRTPTLDEGDPEPWYPPERVFCTEHKQAIEILDAKLDKLPDFAPNVTWSPL